MEREPGWVRRPIARGDAEEAGAPGTAEPLKTFILPSGDPAGAALHLARTVCRRAERRAITLQGSTSPSPFVIPYLNRLSDLLFVMARAANSTTRKTRSLLADSSFGFHKFRCLA